jgi:phasin family protein
MTKQAFPYDFTDFAKMMKDYQLPGVDWQEVMASQQKNVEALTKANQVLFEGAQTVVRREVEILQQAMQEFSAASRDLMQEGDAKAQAHKRLELAKASFETALQNMRELAELAGKSHREALELINRRAIEGFEEIRRAVTQQREAGPPKS